MLLLIDGERIVMTPAKKPTFNDIPPDLCQVCEHPLKSEESLKEGLCGLCRRNMKAAKRMHVKIKKVPVKKKSKHPWGFEKI